MQQPPVVPIPRMLVLNYVSRSSTPTCARKIAWAALILAAVACLIGSGLLFLTGARESYRHAFWARSYLYSLTLSLSPGSSPPSFSAEFADFLREFVQLPVTWWGVIPLGLGILYLISGVGVRRGNRRAAISAVWSFSLMPATLLLATTACLWLLLFGMCEEQEPVYAWLLVPILAVFFLTLLALDVHTMLRWVARNPLGEMGKRRFIPAKK